VCTHSEKERERERERERDRQTDRQTEHFDLTNPIFSLKKLDCVTWKNANVEEEHALGVSHDIRKRNMN
jgi:hypothetical protein